MQVLGDRFQKVGVDFHNSPLAEDGYFKDHTGLCIFSFDNHTLGVQKYQKLGPPWQSLRNY